MKILVITQYFYPEQFRINDICVALSKKHEVTVLTGLPNYPHGQIYQGYEKGHFFETYHGIPVYRCNLRPRKTGTLNLILNYFSFVRNAKKRLKDIPTDFDVIYVYGVSPVTMALPAIKFGKKHKIPVYYYCCDLWPEAVLGAQNGHKQISRKHPIFWLANCISKYVYKNVSLIGVKCDEFSDYIHQICHIEKKKMKLLYEHAEETYLQVMEKPIQNDIVDFMFLGNIGEVQNCDQIVKAYSQTIPRNESVLHFVGDGSALQTIKAQVLALGLEQRVIFHGRHDLQEVINFYNFADVCLLTLSNRTATGLTPPAKLVGYMAASRPVIASINGAAQKILSDSKCGVAVSADDVEGLKELMQKIIDDPSRLDGMGARGRAYFLENFTLDKHINELQNQLESIRR